MDIINVDLYGGKGIFGGKETPLEAAIIDYIGLRGHDDEIDTTAITEIADYFRYQIKQEIPPGQPFVGADFNTTSAGIHVDGLEKNEEIYNIFDTDTILNRPPTIVITDKSGAAGIAHWVNEHLKLEPRSRVDKQHPGVLAINKWVIEQYTGGRVTSISNSEMQMQSVAHLPEYFDTDIKLIKEVSLRIMQDTINKLVNDPAIISMDRKKQEPILQNVFKGNPYVQLALIVDKEGVKNTSMFVRTGAITPEQEAKLDKDYIKRPWFLVPYENEHIHVTGLFQSRITGNLGLTISAPIKDGEVVAGILRLDINFEEIMRYSRTEMEQSGKLLG